MLKKKTVAKPKNTKITRKKEAKSAASIAVFGLHNIKSPLGSHKKRKLLGRGSGSGHGKTSTRGSKGQTSRSGRDFYAGFEGGQSPLIRRFPKRGFTNIFRKPYQVLNLKDLARLKEETITPEIMEKSGLIRDKGKLIKILGEGEIKKPLTVQAHAFSKTASQKIQAAGGKPEIINA